MSSRRRRARWLISLALFAGFVVVGYAGWGLWDALNPDVRVEMVVNVPVLSAGAEAGRGAYDLRCAPCHGPHAAGSVIGPPLVHPIYRPAHHADVAFKLAVRRGVRGHHFRLGDMPPQPDVPADELEAIVRYIRELQRANGIE